MGNLDFGCMVSLPNSIYITRLYSLQVLFTYSPSGSVFVNWVHKELKFPSSCPHCGSSLETVPQEVDAREKGLKVEMATSKN